MKSFLIALCTITLFFAGCSIIKNTTQDGKMQVVNAGYTKWSEPPVESGDVPEKGTDLAVIVKNWPMDAEPMYIVFQNRKSFKAFVTDVADPGVVINARIVLSSSTLMQTSEEVNQSDRLVYQTADGETEYIEIKEWTRLEEPNADE